MFSEGSVGVGDAKGRGHREGRSETTYYVAVVISNDNGEMGGEVTVTNMRIKTA